MTQSLFLFTIGPVQSFIIQARKTQDLYAGSYLLSHLARTAARAIQGSDGQLIFPDMEYASLPNRMLALYADIDQERQKGIGSLVEKAVRKEFKKIGDTILDSLSLPKPQFFNCQLEKYLETYWVFHPLANDTYLEEYNSLMVYLGAVKNTRCFRQLKETGQKCTIGGEHNIVFYREMSGRKRFKTGMELPAMVPQKYMKDGEGLGAVNFIKRCADQYFGAQLSNNYENDFPSTARIAFMDTWHWLDQKDPEKKWPYKGIEEQLLFEMKEKKVVYSDVDQATREVYKLVHARKMCPYYAILRFDGDNMGKWYGAPDIKQGSSSLDFHKELSRQLQLFAEEVVAKIIIWPKGRVIYAGGEDFLGFLNLKYLLEVITELRDKFGRIDLTSFTDKKLTFSAGIAIAHFKSPPLYETLKWAHRMEQAAKNIDNNKDAFGLAAIKRSGEISSFVYKWQAGDQWLSKILGDLVGYLQREEFSSSFIRHLNMSLARLVGSDGYFEGDEQIIKAEIKRLVERAILLTKEKGEDSQAFENKKAATISDVVGKVETLYNNSQSQGIKNFLNGLNVIAFLERVMEP